MLRPAARPSGDSERPHAGGAVRRGLPAASGCLPPGSCSCSLRLCTHGRLEPRETGSVTSSGGESRGSLPQPPAASRSPSHSPCTHTSLQAEPHGMAGKGGHPVLSGAASWALCRNRPLPASVAAALAVVAALLREAKAWVASCCSGTLSSEAGPPGPAWGHPQCPGLTPPHVAPACCPQVSYTGVKGSMSPEPTGRPRLPPGVSMPLPKGRVPASLCLDQRSRALPRARGPRRAQVRRASDPTPQERRSPDTGSCRGKRPSGHSWDLGCQRDVWVSLSQRGGM